MYRCPVKQWVGLSFYVIIGTVCDGSLWLRAECEYSMGIGMYDKLVYRFAGPAPTLREFAYVQNEASRILERWRLIVKGE